MRSLVALSLLALLGTAAGAGAVPSIVEPVMEGVTVVRDDGGGWRTDLSKSITHQLKPEYQARKILDLSGVPEGTWQQVKAVRLSAYFMVRDYSWKDAPPANGLDEAFEVVVNGKAHRFATHCGAPVYAEGKGPAIAWYDMPLPKEEFTRGVNEVILRKAEGAKYDDYLYLGIDNSARRGNSSVTFDGKEWTSEKLTIPGSGGGEYLVRLYLITKETRARVEWHPGLQPRLEDPAGLVGYAGGPGAVPAEGGLKLAPGTSARLEWDAAALDDIEPMKATVSATGPVQTAWLGADTKPAEVATGTAALERTLPAGRTLRPSGLVITALKEPVTLSGVVLDASLSYHPRKAKIDLCPRIAPPAGKPAKRTPACRIDRGGAALENAGLRCRFTNDGRLKLASIYNELTACEMVRDPAQVALFLVEVDGKRYAGSRDFRCTALRARKEGGFVAELTLPQPALKATLTAGMDAEGLRLGLNLANAGKAPVEFKLAFPHLAGLTASGKPATDYFFFPWGGGIVADTPAIIRRGYGDHEAIYQVMDLYSPSRGAGLSIRADDSQGWHKVLALRKHVPGMTEQDAQVLSMNVAEEYRWTNPLDAVEGTGFAYEYLRRTRTPGQSFAPAPAVLAAHPGDWHQTMRAYSAWAHRAWKFRPYPSRLKSVRNMIAAGWGQGYLFRDGKYRTDIIGPDTDCIELMSWWDWSPLGPWSTPIDKIAEKHGEAMLKYWQHYFVKDPVTGQMMWSNQPGDYDGYNERFGGLPAFRKAVNTYREMGSLVTLYTDPIRCDDNTKIGRKYGKLWGVVKPDGKHVDSYDVWNMCHDVAEYRQWVADNMGRVMRETGADGIRLDEYGHRGWACYSTLHKHTYAEPGITQWQKEIAETCRMVHAAMDQVKPDSVLTTEHPGYDYELQFLEGCITYDLTVMKTPLRPLECNLQRFYFPECKAYELDHQGADLQSRKKLWNAVESFGRYYPPAMYALLNENEDAYQGRTCEPLVPTLQRYVYANRFGAGEKVLYHLYNAAGHTVEAPMLAVSLSPSEHLFDLLNCREVPVVKGAAALYLERDDVAVLAKLPKRLTVAREGNAFRVSAKAAPAGAKLVLADREGKALLTQNATQGKLDLSQLPAEAKPACVKLLGPKGLVDAVAAP